MWFILIPEELTGNWQGFFACVLAWTRANLDEQDVVRFLMNITCKKHFLIFHSLFLTMEMIFPNFCYIFYLNRNRLSI